MSAKSSKQRVGGSFSWQNIPSKGVKGQNIQYIGLTGEK
jgi:hypothetical protein